ncbi:Histidine kinase [Parapedobacter composti]|uniref:Histidine kinase n=1 Tax=Parapedobacter composti TaxID=623281 RepID=A0A1I1F768_9SPHI|nr:histidine kinase [Parapedobacter composti]SFB92950.1 Histidine kinase [Parapedobacter composti]
MKRFYPLTGLVISLFVALLGYVLRSYREEAIASLLTFAGAFANAFLNWLLVQWVIQLTVPRHYGWKSVVAITGCMVISLVLFYGLRDVSEVRERVVVLPRGMHAVHFLLLMRGMVIGGFLFFIAYLLRMAAMSQQSKLENERLKKENLQARLTLLQEQVHPHFLFNSLGTLRSMVSEPVPRQFIQRLAEVYRYLLNSRQADLVTLREELDFTEAYLHILKERFEDALVIGIDVNEACYARKLPPMTLQLLIENAVKHNTVADTAPLTINIYTIGANWLAVSNSLNRKRFVPIGTGTGLSNIRERYRLLAGLEVRVRQLEDRFTVAVPLIINGS